MLKLPKLFWLITLIGLVTVFFLFLPSGLSARAQTATPTGTPLSPADNMASPTPSPTPPPRIVVATEDYTGYIWWVVSYSNHKVLCNIGTDHMGLPQDSEIQGWCGDSVYQQFKATNPCDLSTQAVCQGVYLFMVKTFLASHQVTKTFNLPTVTVSLNDCKPGTPANLCTRHSSLQFTAFEPMLDQKIVSIEGKINEDEFKCEVNPCLVPLPLTGPSGAHVEFWANSSWGDSSKHETALIRVVSSQDANISSVSSQSLVAEVASNQWVGAPTYSCSRVWEALPDKNGLPVWLHSTDQVAVIRTSNAYYYLAGALIRSGQVDVRSCPGGGMQNSSIPNQCGLAKAMPLVDKWQNQFDQSIVSVAAQDDIPTVLIKSMFGKESQFWPGVYSFNSEVGLGQLTSDGVDTLFMWNPAFFQKFCVSVYSAIPCSKGYNNFSSYKKNVLRGALLGKVNASCEGCLFQIDLNQARFSIDVFASSLEANCEQVGQIIYNVTGQSPGDSASYIDLWKFTLVNYNAGAGCLQDAIFQANDSGLAINWDNVSGLLAPGCQGARKYVEDITNIQLQNNTGSGQPSQ